MRLRRRAAGPARPRLWSPTLASTNFGESTFAELSWDRSRNAAFRWGLAGLLVGAIVATVAFAPAAWLAGWIAERSGQRLSLADARGTVWSGSAVAVLTGGPGSRDAAALPGRLVWTVGVRGLGIELRAAQACCLNGEVALRVRPGFGRVAFALVPPPGWVGRWPAAFLGGLGTPWNTMQLGGTVLLSSPGLKVESVQGRWLVDGRADIALGDVSSSLSTLDTLGSYRMVVSGDPATPGVSQLVLSTEQGALQLAGTGTWGPGGLRFRGEATAAPGNEAALASLLNIIGRRSGARSVISIG